MRFRFLIWVILPVLYVVPSASADTCKIVAGLSREVLERPVSAADLAKEVVGAKWFVGLGRDSQKQVVFAMGKLDDWLWKHPGAHEGNVASLTLGWCDQNLINKADWKWNQ